MGVEIRFLHLVASEALSFEMQGPSSKSKVPYPIDMAATRKCWVGGGGAVNWGPSARESRALPPFQF